MNASLTTEHPAVQRAVERLKKSVRKDHIRRIGPRRYEVISGRSGECYRVDTERMTCTCTAASLGRLCRHRIAAFGFERALAAISSAASVTGSH